MTSPFTPGIAAGRLDAETLAAQFSDLHAPYDAHEAAVAADRCYFCHDAPCITACPTDIDIPLFIRQIATGLPKAAARTILEQNILGGMCARVCPTETLCEQACVREAAEGKPVEIGRLQRFATDSVMATNGHPFTRAAPTGKRVAVVGAGPAGLSCAHRLALLGHDVDLYDANPKPGGLNEYGIASYKATDDFAAREAAWLMQIGGITLHAGRRLGTDLSLSDLQASHDAVFLGLGLGAVNALTCEGNDREGVLDAVTFIRDLRQAADLSSLPIGRDVVVIGGGMTAVDAAVQAKLLGAQSVTISYRRDQSQMPASRYEQDLATSKGVRILANTMPVAIDADGIVLEYTTSANGALTGTGETVHLKADQVFRAIGQSFAGIDGPVLERGKIAVTGAGRTSVPGIWAGGDCTPGEDLTVVAVAEGRDAAMDIHDALTGD